MKCINGILVLLACFACGTAKAEISGGVVRIGVLNDISGLFQDTNGMGSVEAARMAAEDFNGGGKNIKVEIVYADHQNKADVGAAIARKWLDVEGVDAIVDVPNSAVGLTINSLLRDTRMTFLASSTASSDLTGKACSPNTIQWVNDVWATGNATAAAMMGRGGKEWYFVTVNFALGQGIEAEATSYIEKHGGKVPSGNQAGVYASTLAYLNAVAATGSDDAKDVVPQMKKFSGKDKLFGDVTIRQDGRVIHPMYLFEVKKPEESKYPYDYYRLVSTIPAEQAFRPLADGGCSLVK